jgi:hypothetical protein
MALDQVNRPAKLDAAIETDSVSYGPRIRLTSFGPMLQTKRQLETPSYVPGFIFTRPPEPFSKVSPNCGDSILPNAVHGGGKIVFVTSGDLRDHSVKAQLRLLKVGWPHWEKSVFPETSEQVELNFVDE